MRLWCTAQIVLNDPAGHRVAAGTRHSPFPWCQASAVGLRRLLGGNAGWASAIAPMRNPCVARFAAMPAAAVPTVGSTARRADGIGIFSSCGTESGRDIRAPAPAGEAAGGRSERVSREHRGGPGARRTVEAVARRLWLAWGTMFEFKVDAATGDSLMREINGRFWGSLQLAIDAGVDFPFYHRAAWRERVYAQRITR